MKNNTENKGLLVTNEMIEKANLGEEITLTATDHLILITKSKMTAMDFIQTIDSLAEITQAYLEILEKNCGGCEDCGHCEELEQEIIQLSDGLLKIADIPANAKLCAYVEEGSGIVRVEQADHEHDITDIPPHLLSLFTNYGICIGELDALLVKGELLHG
jgi:hypothetical protein|nr:hypothetical protein [uncultured Lachnoclostridium sp.]